MTSEINSNGNGIKKDIEHQEKVGELVHEQIKSEIRSIRESTDSRLGKIEENVDNNRQVVDTKYKSLITVMVSILAVITMFVVAGDQLNQSLQEDNFEMLYEKLDSVDEVVDQQRGFVDCVRDGTCILSTQHEMEIRLLKEIQDLKNEIP